MDWYKHYIEAHAVETDEIPDAEDLAYRRMRDIYYTTEKPLPADVQVVSDWVKLDEDVVEPVLEKFFKSTPEGFIHEGWQMDIAQRQHVTEKNRENGKRGGRKPRGVV